MLKLGKFQANWDELVTPMVWSLLKTGSESGKGESGLKPSRV